MEKELYKHEIHMAVALLLCLWFKLDAVIEYGIVNSSSFLIASCILLLAIILGRTLWLLLINHKRLWAIMKGVFMSKTFDAISSVAFLMPLICIEKYNVYFACASWVLGDIVLVGRCWQAINSLIFERLCEFILIKECISDALFFVKLYCEN